MRTTSFLHFFILSFSLSFQFLSTRLLPCFFASLLPCHREKKSYVRTRSYYYIWHSNLCTTSGAEWELITPGSPTNLVYPKQYLRRGRHDDISRLEFIRRC